MFYYVRELMLLIFVSLTALILNGYWLLFGLLYKGPARFVVRTLWVVYLTVPIIVAMLLAVSASKEQLDPRGDDIRPYIYACIAIAVGSLIAVVGMIVMMHSHPGRFRINHEAEQCGPENPVPSGTSDAKASGVPDSRGL